MAGGQVPADRATEVIVPAKFEGCVGHVRTASPFANPYAVCQVSVMHRPSLHALTGRYFKSSAGTKRDVTIVLEYVRSHPGLKRYEVVQALASTKGIPMARSLEAMKVLRQRGDLDCDEGLCQATAQGMFS